MSDNKSKSPDAFDDILFSSDEELADRKVDRDDQVSDGSVASPSVTLGMDETATEQPIVELEKSDLAISSQIDSDSELEFEGELAFDEELPHSSADVDIIPTLDAVKQERSEKVLKPAKPKSFDEDYADVAVEDALFSSDEELEQAMDMPEQQIQQKVVKKAAAKVEPEPVPSVKAIDYEPYLHSDENITLMQALVASAPGLAITSKRLNTSLVPEVDWPVQEVVDEELLEEFLQARLAKQEERAAQAQALTEKTATKKAFVQQLYKVQKLRVDEYLGRSLPKREIELDFKFPPNLSSQGVGVILTGNQIHEIFAKKKESLLTVFKKSDRALEAITLGDLSAGKLQHLLEAFYPLFIEKTQAFIASCYKYPSIPLVDERQEIAELAVASMRYLIVAHKQLYEKYYQSNNMLYGSKRALANQSAWRLLELLCLEQQLSSALYRTHHDNASATFNKVYNVLCAYEEDFVYEKTQSLVFNENLSVQQMFVRYQIEFAFDITGISASLHKRLRAYWSQRSALILPLTAEQLSSDWVDDCWVVGHGHAGRARFDNSASLQELPASYIHIEPFLHQIQKDYAQAIDILQKKDLSDLPRLLGVQAFDLLKGADILQILSVLSQQVISIEKNLRLPKYTSFNKFDVEIDVFSSFQSAQIFFRKLVKEKSEAHLGGHGQNNSEEKSVISSAKKRGGNGGYWDVAMEDDRGIFLQTIESKVCPTIDVGQFMLLVKHLDLNDSTIEAEQAIPLKIINIERGVANKVVLSAEKLGERCMAVELRNEQQEVLPGLVSVQQGHRRLIVDMQWDFRSGDKFTMILPNAEETEISIAALLSVSTAMQVFSIF